MADSTYQPAVYRKQGAAVYVVTTSGSLDIEGKGAITDDGTQASHIANFATSSAANMSAVDRAKLNTLLVALEGIGVLATA